MPWSVPFLPAWSALLVLVVLSAFVGLARLEYANKVHVAGIVRPRALPLTVVSTQSGKVSNLTVAQDEKVHAEQTLMFIDKRVHGPNGVAHSELLIKQLSLQQEALREQARRYDARQQQTLAILISSDEGLQTQVETRRAELVVLAQRARLAEKSWLRSRALALQGWLSDNDLAKAESVFLAAQARQLEVQLAQQVAQDRLHELAGKQLLHELEGRGRRTQFRDEILQLEQDMRQIDAKVKVAVLAPIAGEIADISVMPGETVSPGMTLVTLLPPSHENHDVELSLPSHAAGQVKVGMPVRVQYSGFPYQDFGTGEGEILRVSTVLDPNSRVPIFQADVAILRLPDRIDHLPAGMAVQADILLETKPLWSWLMAPIVSMFARI